MQFESFGNTAVAAKISKDELKKLGVSFESLDYANESTRRALKEIYALSPSGTAFGEKMRIDVFPDKSDGCVILFSFLNEGSKNCASVFKTNSFDCLCDLANVLFKTGLSSESNCLYIFENEFYLVITAPKSTLALCGEYLQKCSLDEGRLEEAAQTKKEDILKILGCGGSDL